MQPDIKQHPIYVHISRHRLFESWLKVTWELELIGILFSV